MMPTIKNFSWSYWKDKSFSFFITIFFGYSFAVFFLSFLLPWLMKDMGRSAFPFSSDVPSIEDHRPQFRDLSKAVLERNLFNETGEIAKDELLPHSRSTDFNPKAPCQSCSLPLTLTGTLVTRNSALAMIQEKGIDQSDPYAKGDVILGSDQAVVYDILPDMVILNNGGRKECLISNWSSRLQKKSWLSSNKTAISPQEKIYVQLESAWVMDQLGNGFSQIIQTARLTPYLEEEKPLGFKIISIDPGTLLEKVGLKVGDIIKEVNETFMGIDQGFALYQAFLDQREIRIKFLRDGRDHFMEVQIR